MNVKTEEPIKVLSDGFSTFLTSAHDEPFLKNLQCYGYGATRILGETAIASDPSPNSESLFAEHIPLINAEEWLLQLDYSARFSSDGNSIARQRFEKVKTLLLEILPEVKDLRVEAPKDKIGRPYIVFETSLGEVELRHLNLGYKAMLVWLVDLSYRLFTRYQDAENPLAEPAIVLIDEIDLHLHPKWQRKVFDMLSKCFPATQFIVTAHSPLIVQAAPEDANLVLLKNVNGKIEIDQSIDGVRNWRIDQILSSELFEVLPRNNDIEEKLKRRTELFKKQDKLTLEERKELDELNKFAASLPYAESETDIQAKELIRKFAERLRQDPQRYSNT